MGSHRQAAVRGHLLYADYRRGAGDQRPDDARLSKDQKISCNFWHDLSKYGVDGQPTSAGIKGQHGNRNSPTVYNAAIHFVQFWDGRASDVEAQAKGPILNPVEMGMASEARVVAVLASMPEYVAAFKRAFPSEK